MMEDKTMDDARMDEQKETQVKTNNNNVVGVKEDNETTDDDVLMEDINAKKYDAVDIDKLLSDLLKANKKAGDLTAEIHDVMLLIGLTGAGKVSRVQKTRRASTSKEKIIKLEEIGFFDC